MRKARCLSRAWVWTLAAPAHERIHDFWRHFEKGERCSDVRRVAPVPVVVRGVTVHHTAATDAHVGGVGGPQQALLLGHAARQVVQAAPRALRGKVARLVGGVWPVKVTKDSWAHSQPERAPKRTPRSVRLTHATDSVLAAC